MTTNDAATAQLNDHTALRADPDPPRRHQRHHHSRTLTLNVTRAERLHLWQTLVDSEGEKVVPVPRQVLVHLLLDHTTMLGKLVDPVKEPPR
jgi:hypothetical protein